MEIEKIIEDKEKLEQQNSSLIERLAVLRKQLRTYQVKGTEQKSEGKFYANPLETSKEESTKHSALERYSKDASVQTFLSTLQTYEDLDVEINIGTHMIESNIKSSSPKKK